MNENNENINSQQDKKEDSVVKKIKTKKIKLKKKKHNKNNIHISIDSLILIMFCTFLLVIATFLQLEITHFIIPIKFFQGKTNGLEDFLYTIKYIPQIPIVLFIGALLGRKYGLLSIILYILTGLFVLPVFALGGGWKYIFEYSFGYILGYIPAVYMVGSQLKNGYTMKNILKAVCISVLVIHLIGIFYMLILSFIKHSGWDFISGWIIHQSGIKIVYDILFSFFAVLVAKYARLILWFYK